MRKEFHDIFAELFRDAVAELEKMVTLKIYAMDLCNVRFEEALLKNQDEPMYNLVVLTNRQINAQTHAEIFKFTQDAMADAGNNEGIGPADGF